MTLYEKNIRLKTNVSRCFVSLQNFHNEMKPKLTQKEYSFHLLGLKR